MNSIKIWKKHVKVSNIYYKGNSSHNILNTVFSNAFLSFSIYNLLPAQSYKVEKCFLPECQFREIASISYLNLKLTNFCLRPRYCIFSVRNGSPTLWWTDVATKTPMWQVLIIIRHCTFIIGKKIGGFMPKLIFKLLEARSSYFIDGCIIHTV